MTNKPVDSIEWRNESSQLAMSDGGNLTVLEYTIPLVTDDLQGHQLSCTATAARSTTYNETVWLDVQGIKMQFT